LYTIVLSALSLAVTHQVPKGMSYNLLLCTSQIFGLSTPGQCLRSSTSSSACFFC